MKTALLLFVSLACLAGICPAQTMQNVVPYTTQEVFEAVLSKDRLYQKDTYEKVSDYVVRLAQLNSETRVSLVQTDTRTLDKTVFVFHDLAKYDAENERFTFALSEIFENGFRYYKGTGKLDYLLTPAKLMNSGSWLGDTSNVLTLRPPSVHMPPDKARQAGPTLALAIYAMPVGVSVGLRQLLVVPMRMVAFNQVTGEIYAESKSQ